MGNCNRQPDGRSLKEFEQNSVRLVLDFGYSMPAAASIVGIGTELLQSWYLKIVSVETPNSNDKLSRKLTVDERIRRERINRSGMGIGALQKPSQDSGPPTPDSKQEVRDRVIRLALQNGSSLAQLESYLDWLDMLDQNK